MFIEAATMFVVPVLFCWRQEKLAAESGLNAKNISLLENNRIDIGKKRAEQLAKAFGVHPAIIMFPEYESDLIGKAA